MPTNRGLLRESKPYMGVILSNGGKGEPCQWGNRPYISRVFVVTAQAVMYAAVHVGYVFRLLLN